MTSRDFYKKYDEFVEEMCGKDAKKEIKEWATNQVMSARAMGMPMSSRPITMETQMEMEALSLSYPSLFKDLLESGRHIKIPHAIMDNINYGLLKQDMTARIREMGQNNPALGGLGGTFNLVPGTNGDILVEDPHGNIYTEPLSLDEESISREAESHGSGSAISLDEAQRRDVQRYFGDKDPGQRAKEVEEHRQRAAKKHKTEMYSAFRRSIHDQQRHFTPEEQHDTRRRGNLRASRQPQGADTVETEDSASFEAARAVHGEGREGPRSGHGEL